MCVIWELCVYVMMGAMCVCYDGSYVCVMMGAMCVCYDGSYVCML